jgi:predicted amidohydrolase
MLKPENKT